MGNPFFFSRLVVVFSLLFNAEPCFAGVLFEIQAYSWSLSSSLSFLPSSEGAAAIKDANREPHLLVIRHHGRFSPDGKCPHYLLFLLVLLNSSCGVVPSDSLLFRDAVMTENRAEMTSGGVLRANLGGLQMGAE